jgi:hypothetical protein
VKPAIPRANVIHDAKHAAAQTIETLAIFLHNRKTQRVPVLFKNTRPHRSAPHFRFEHRRCIL